MEFAFELGPKRVSKEELKNVFTEAERILEVEGREKAIPALTPIYSMMKLLNKSGMLDFRLQWTWNPEGSFTEEEFNDLNLRRKKLSNAIGIMTASGAVRHDLNEL